MIAALRCGASFGAEWAGVCPALFMRPRMPWPQVRQGSDGVGLPPIKGRARRRRLATIQSAGEAFQGVALDDAGSEKRSSYWGYATAKGRFQSPSLEGKRQVLVVYLDGPGRATDPTFMAAVLPHIARQTTYDIILKAQAQAEGRANGTPMELVCRAVQGYLL